ncbi:hypothetical protein Ahy_A07g037432 isoform D [Arachis hypogaea]|uniref:Calcium-transporting ATPase n=1 Tax=Arachis hypogaea TaxID=3818 RepID=A0A445CIR7_ARAHY|nr:hypothetical protein Ahy_A07g037432 isoform D [Arachis hypogaea]
MEAEGSSQASAAASESQATSERIKLNVGGKLFETTLSTIRSAGPDSLLFVLSNRPANDPNPVFIDRDPEIFSVLLSLLRTNQIPSAARRFSTQELADEAAFYGIDSHFRSAAAPPPFSGIDASIVKSISPASEGLPSTFAVADNGAVWIAHGGQISSYDWSLAHTGTLRTHLDEIDSICRVWTEIAAVGSESDAGLHFYDFSSSRHVGSVHWTDPSDPRIFKARVNAITASETSVFASFDCPHRENIVLEIDKERIQIVSQLGRQSGNQAKHMVPSKLTFVPATGVLVGTAITSGAFGYSGYIRIWDPRSGDVVWETNEPGAGRSSRFGDSFADVDVDAEGLSIFKLCSKSGDLGMADMRRLGDDPWVYLEEKNPSMVNYGGEVNNLLMHCCWGQVFVGRGGSLEVWSRVQAHGGSIEAVSDYRQSLQFKNLNAEKQNIQLEVTRGGRTIKLSIFDIVVGDVVPLKIGDQVPADGVLITGHSLAIDESSMTGESKIVQKDHKAPFLMSGCKVADGVGTMLVTGVGINTEWGLLMASISEDNGEETPLQVRLNGVATFVGIVGLTVAVSVLAVLLGRYFSGNTKDVDGQVQFVAGKTSISDAVDGVIKLFTIAVTIVVVAVPEGLPLAVTLTLAFSMRKMMADKALVRRLSACETMGSATTICSDKTGTLTLNQMTVVEAYAGRKKQDPPDDSSKLHPEVLSLINEGIAQNTTGNVFVPKDGGEAEISGSPTEKAILSWAVKLGMNFDLTRSNSTVLHVFPFNSEKKRGGVALKMGVSGVHIHWKGAAEIVLGACTQYLDSNGQLQSIEKDKVFFTEAIEDMAVQSLRCVAIAYRPYELDKVPSKQEDLDKWSLPEQELILLAIVGIKDPCRPGVKEAVRLCSQAGVKVRMVTGDNLNTAKAIALECGILSSKEEAVEPNIIEGKTFRELSEIEREQVAKKITVMGRSSPNDKLLLVQALRKLGEVVAVTGDGTNDAPALHEADIGLSMGIQGTEVAKESSDIIILDDNFASVVKVVRWGRSVYANIQKFIQFQLTVNVAALVINVVAAVSAGEVPLNAVQLLWVNLIMDTLGALALATEPPTDSLMRRSPVGRRFVLLHLDLISAFYHVSRLNFTPCALPRFFRESLITNVMWRNLVIQAVYQVTILLILNFGWQSINLGDDQDSKSHSLQVKNTLIFNTFVLCQIFNEFNARKIDQMNVFKGVTKNRLFMGIVGMTFVLQILIIEFLGKFTSTVRLDWKLWLFSLGIGIISWKTNSSSENTMVTDLKEAYQTTQEVSYYCCCATTIDTRENWLVIGGGKKKSKIYI